MWTKKRKKTPSEQIKWNCCCYFNTWQLLLPYLPIWAPSSVYHIRLTLLSCQNMKLYTRIFIFVEKTTTQQKTNSIIGRTCVQYLQLGIRYSLPDHRTPCTRALHTFNHRIYYNNYCTYKDITIKFYVKTISVSVFTLLLFARRIFATKRYSSNLHRRRILCWCHTLNWVRC